MSQLIVRNLDPAVVRALRMRAAEHGRSAEAEHREILRQALGLDAGAAAFKTLLGAMPDVIRDDELLPVRDLPRDIP